jgi:hypothetical protein
MKDEARVARLLEAVRPQQSAYRFLIDNHDRAAEALVRPRWADVAAWMAREGMTDARGNPPSGASARQMWFRARQEVAARRAAQARRAGPARPGQRDEAAQPAAGQAQPGSTAQRDVDEEFRRAGLFRNDGGRVPDIMKWQGEDQ